MLPTNSRRAPAVASLALAAALGVTSAVGAQALSQAQIDALTRRAAGRLEFTTKLQGRWTCNGAAEDGKARRATMLLFMVRPAVYEFELTPIPATVTWSNIVETWTWKWSFGSSGRWFATADARTAGAGTQFVSDGWAGSTLVWKQFASPSTIARTFEVRPNGTLAFGAHDVSEDASPRSDYRLTCRRSPAAAVSRRP